MAEGKPCLTLSVSLLHLYYPPPPPPPPLPPSPDTILGPLDHPAGYKPKAHRFFALDPSHRVSVCVCMCTCVRACMRACVHACVHACVYASIYVLSLFCCS